MSVKEKTPEQWLGAVKKDGLTLKNVPAAFKTPEVCIVAVRQNALALEFVPEALKTLGLFQSVISDLQSKASALSKKVNRSAAKAQTKPSRGLK